ncbi:two-component system chemotaxis response regulator CheB [Mucilaginibacter gracilis]|uniref:protein-glutamate methylesterase n=1 Tax=Mucilaginibacter gracilis TaxID=423350 RepID=A0A495J150_9SPHI|nr:chemotaxis protein CheB [Mucilaginibacter gracilis]RKR82690.1 two-component system chemotaxis response regulator CheB [Mucilaginibacter gracilis]
MDSDNYENLLKRLSAAEVVILGGSAGSFTPIFNIIKMLPQTYNKAIVIVIHRGKNNFSDIENLFGDNCRILVSEITDKDKITGGHVYIAPANYHTLFEKRKTFALDVSEQVWYSKPSIDVTFESAADAYGDKCAAILLSGANQDGASGLLKLRNKGALTIVQRPTDAEIGIMPQAAVDINAGEFILTSSEILKLISASSTETQSS